MHLIAIHRRMRKVEADDFYKLRFVNDPQVSGRKVAFVVSKPDRNGDEYNSTIWIYDGRNRRFTHGPKDSRPRWSADGRKMAFVSKRGKDKKSQIMAIAADGGEAEVVCEFDGEIGDIAWAGDGRSVFFLGTAQKGDRKDDVKRITKYPFYFNGKGFIHDRETHVYHAGPGGKPKQITSGPFTVNSFDVVPGRDMLVLSLRMDEWDVNTSDIYSCTFDGKKLKSLTGQPANNDLPSVSPDGGTVAFLHKGKEKGLFAHERLCFVPVTGGKVTESGGPDLNIGNGLNSDSRVATDVTLRWSDDGASVYFISTDGGNCDLYRCDVRTLHNSRVLGGIGSIESFDFFGEGFALVAQTASEPVELFVHSGGKNRRVTNFNSAMRSRGLQEPKHIEFKSFDGRPIDGWVLSGSARKGSPAVLEIHGGPKTAYGNAFEFEFHYLASNGYSVMYCNPRGSDGYSEEFAMQVKGHFGEGDYRDLMQFVDVCLEEHSGWDGKRLGVTGGSYGGFMTNWIVGHTDRFRAAVTQRSICNQTSFYGTSDIGPFFNSDQIGGSIWENTEGYWEKSPLKYAVNVKTPLLIIHSEEDYRCPVEQAYQMYTALRQQGKVVEMELFPGENHDLSRAGKPKHRVRRLSSIKGWFDRHL